MAREGAESVLQYVARTAEHVSDGVRWRTLSYRNEPHYDANLYNGVAGITLFLSDYFRITGDATARDLAEGGLRWCSIPDRPSGVDPRGLALPKSLFLGVAGMGLAWLQFAAATGDAAALDQATAYGQRLLADEPGPWAELGRGAIGEGLFLVRLWQEARDDQVLAGAARWGEWFQQTAIRDARGCHWLRVREPGNPRSRSCMGFHVGNAGIGTFLLALFEATQDERWAVLAREAAETLLRHAVPDRGGLNWPFALDGDAGDPGNSSDLARCQWCVGAPGIGTFFATAYVALGERRYRDAAEAAAATTLAYGDLRVNPSACHGLAGSAEVFLALYRATHEPRWLTHAHDFGRRMLAYRTVGPDGDVWQADDPGFTSPDFFCGAAGAGHFFLRLAAPDRLRLPFI